MTAIFDRHSSGFCKTHKKQSYNSRARAKAVIRGHHDAGMREYECDANDGGFWHIGHLPPAVRDGERTSDEHYTAKANGGAAGIAVLAAPPDGPLTFKPSPANIKPLNGHKTAIAVPGVREDNSIERLLLAAEESGVAAALKLAERIRALVAELIELIHVSSKERELRDLVAERRRLLDEALQELQDFKGGPTRRRTSPARRIVVRATHPAGQAEVRAWARANGHEVPSRGSIPVAIREAYEAANGGAS